MKIIQPGPLRQRTLAIRRLAIIQETERSISHLIQNGTITSDFSPSEKADLLCLCHSIDTDHQLLLNQLTFLDKLLVGSRNRYLPPDAFRYAIELYGGSVAPLLPFAELASQRQRLIDPSPPTPISFQPPLPCTFHPFPRLPAELRLCIYELAFHADLLPKTHFLSARHRWRPNTTLELVSHLRASDEEHYSRFGGVCREARTWWLFRTGYVWAFGTWVCWWKDVFWVDDRMGGEMVGSLRGGDRGVDVGMRMQTEGDVGDGVEGITTDEEDEHEVEERELLLTPQAYAQVLSQPGMAQIQNVVLRRRIFLDNPLEGNYQVAWDTLRGYLSGMKQLWVVMNESRGVEEIKWAGEPRFRGLTARERRAWRDVGYARGFVKALGEEVRRIDSEGGGLRSRRESGGGSSEGMGVEGEEINGKRGREKVKIDFVLVGTREDWSEDGERNLEFVRRIRYPGLRDF